MDKKKLYESIMRNVAKEVKKALNELKTETYAAAGLKRSGDRLTLKTRDIKAAVRNFQNEFGGTFTVATGFRVKCNNILKIEVKPIHDNKWDNGEIDNYHVVIEYIVERSLAKGAEYSIITPSVSQYSGLWSYSCGTGKNYTTDKQKALTTFFNMANEYRQMPESFRKKIKNAIVEFERLKKLYIENTIEPNDVDDWMKN